MNIRNRWFHIGILFIVVCLFLSSCDSIAKGDAAAATEEAAQEEGIPAPMDLADDASEPLEIPERPEAVVDKEEEDPYTGPPPVEPDVVLPEEDFDLVFYFGAAASGDYEYAIAPEGSEEWVPLSSGWAGTCGNGDVQGLIGASFAVGKYMLNFSDETGVLWKLRAEDPESGELVNCWRNIPITDSRTRLTLTYSEPDGYLPWLGQDLLVVDSMLFCAHCPEAWDEAPSDTIAFGGWLPLAFTGETVNPFTPCQDWYMEPGRNLTSEPEFLWPDSTFDLVFYSHLSFGDALLYYIAPEGMDDMEQPIRFTAGSCYNEYAHGLQVRQRKYQFDFSGQTSELWQIRAENNEQIMDDVTIHFIFHNIPITGTDTYLCSMFLPNSSAGWTILLVSRAQFCEYCPKGWLETNGK